MDHDNLESLELALSETYYRFLYTLPEEEKESVRYMVHLQHAYWYYTDHLVSKFNLPNIPFRHFLKLMKDRFKFLPGHSLKELMDSFDAYTFQIPVRGAILLNGSLKKVLMVSSISGRSYGFPKGKINEDESDEHCAIREVLEEVGYDISEKLNPQEYLQSSDAQCKLFIVTGVSEDFRFQTHTVGEIGRIEWIDLDKIPSRNNRQFSVYKQYNFNSVYEFLPRLRQWVEARRLYTPECLDPTSPEFLEMFKSKFSRKIFFYKHFALDSSRVAEQLGKFLH